VNSIRKLAVYLKPYWHWATLAPLLMVLEVAMDLMQPRLIERIVDVGIAQRDMQMVIHTGLLMIGYACIGAVGGIGCTFFATLASLGFGADLRETLFKKVESLSFGNLDELETGQLITRLTNDVTQIEMMVTTMLVMLVRAPLTLIGSLVLAITTSPRLTFILVTLIPVVLAVVLFVIRRAYPLFLGIQRRLDDLNTVMQENLSGVRVVKAFVRGDYEEDRFRATNADLMQQTVHAARTIAVTMPVMIMTLNLGVIATLWFGGVQVAGGNMQVGQIIAFTNYLMRTLMSLMFVSMMVMRLARAQASADRVQEVLESEPKVQNRPGAQTSFAPRGQVAFEGVHFSYDGEDGQDAVLKDLNFVAEPGQTVAILGATGSGKSSLVHLIPRFYDVSQGRITLDGVDVRDVDKVALRRNIGIALQESVLFTGTIRDNIRYGRPEATDEQVVAAAKAAQAHDFILEFPEGYDTLVGQRGVNLSGGQKQRIAIARALITQPAVLVLDDSTSSVDVETETKIQDALVELMADRTSFVIAQRISTVLTADKILVLDNGRVVAEGTHRELLQESPIYREIYDSQLGADGKRSTGVNTNVAA
jgi:ATP-binding cassette subfamily B multidrug efflux pump